MATAAQLGEELVKLRTERKALFDSKKNADGGFDLTPEDREKADKMYADIEAKQKAYDAAAGDEAIVEADGEAIKRLSTPNGRKTRDGNPGEPELPATKSGLSLGEYVVQSEAWQNRVSGKGVSVEIDLGEVFGKDVARKGFKALFDTSSLTPESVRLPVIVTPGEQQPTVASLMPNGRTSQPVIKYMEETTTTPGASETAESGEKPEAAIAFTERTANVVKIAVTLPVTDESLEDNDFIESYLNTRLQAFVMQREDSQLINGTGGGSPAQLKGILAYSIGATSQGSDNLADAIHKAMTEIQVDSYLPATGVVIHPSDWETLRLMRENDDDGTGAYLFGPPSQAGDSTIWGLSKVVTTAISQGTVLVGNFQLGAQVFRRSDIRLDIGYVDDQFRLNQRTIRAEERLALVVFRPLAFNEVTLAS